MTINKIKIIGLFKFLNYDINLKPGINILHGINGKGKTTILNIFTNILNGDLKKFYQLSFKEITIEFEKNSFIRLYRVQENKSSIIYFDFAYDSEYFEKRDVRKTNSVEAFTRRINTQPLFLPAQRISLQETYYQEEDLNYRYHYERRFKKDVEFFQPTPKMVNVLNIPKNIVERVRKFSFIMNQNFSALDNSLFEQYFENIFFSKPFPITNQESKSALIKLDQIRKAKNIYFNKYKSIYKSSRVLEQIEHNLENIDNVSLEIMKFLDLYLNNIIQKNTIIEKYIEPFIAFESIINHLFEGKRINIKMDTPIKEIFNIISESGDGLEIKHLSSGEKNLILIFYHYLFQLEEKTFFMIDEPELSLHIDWQEHIIKYLLDYSKKNQILVVTHSPDIVQGYREFEINLDKCRVNL